MLHNTFLERKIRGGAYEEWKIEFWRNWREEFFSKNFNKTIFAVVNGEFYNYENIKKELGLEFKTKSDSE